MSRIRRTAVRNVSLDTGTGDQNALFERAVLRSAVADVLRVGVLVALIGGILLGPRSAPAGERGADPGQTADSLSAAAIAFQLRYGAAPAPSANAPLRDRWLARDKVQHVVFSGLWTLSTQYVLVNKADWAESDALPVSVASGATIGILKELYDASRLTGRASGKDLVADAVGIGLAVAVIEL